MGYQFYNNWPYYNSVFPTMEDHVDPINHVYFTGLMTELENIENELGLDPSGSYNTVKDRLDAIPGVFKLNLLDNPSFETWQRGTTTRPDRWQTYLTTVMERSTTQVKYGKYSIHIQSNTDTGNWNLKQFIENPGNYSGKTVTFSAWFYNPSSNCKAMVGIIDNYTQDTSGWILQTGQWTKISVTRVVTDPCTSLSVCIGTQYGSGDDIYFDGAALWEGDASAFISLSPAEDLARCQRWFWKTNRFIVQGYAGAGGHAYRWIPYPTTMAGTPTTTISGGENSNSSAETISSSQSNDHGFCVVITITGAGEGFWQCTAGQPGYIQAEVTEPT